MTAMGGASRSARAAYAKKRTNTAALLVEDTHWNFSVDLSVFQAHLPWQLSSLPSLWLMISLPGGGNRPHSSDAGRLVDGPLDSSPPSGDRSRGRPEACASRRDLWNGWPFPLRRRLPPAAGPLRPWGHGWKIMGWICGVWMMGCGQKTAGKQGDFGKNKNPAGFGSRRGSKRKPMNDSDLELPACLHGIVAEAKSARVRHLAASLDGQLHAMDHIHDRRP